MSQTSAPVTERPVEKMRGAARIFRLFDIDVHVHWSWLIVALIQIQWRAGAYSSVLWNIVEYVGLFLIVLLHEYGHALACKSVGGKSENIMLWPLGGVAYVQPPQRPGAVLWSLAAGPLVNLVIGPVLLFLAIFASQAVPESDLTTFLETMTAINVIVFLFNVLPIYPLDGGQMLRAVLWYFMGPHRSLKVATAMGLVGAGLGLLYALSLGSVWLVLIVAFGAMSSWNGFKVARARAALAESPRHGHTSCPACREAPPAGEYWPCPGCARGFDPFATDGGCQRCGNRVPEAPCPFCGTSIPVGGAGGPVLDITAEIVDADTHS